MPDEYPTILSVADLLAAQENLLRIVAMLNAGGEFTLLARDASLLEKVANVLGAVARKEME